MSARILIALAIILLGPAAAFSDARSLERTQPVQFRFVATEAADHVAIAGDFNQWRVNHDVMDEVAPGIWETELLLAPGEYQYKFVINDHVWVTDPSSGALVSDAFGGQNSSILIDGMHPLHIAFFEDSLAGRDWQVSLSGSTFARHGLLPRLSQLGPGFWSFSGQAPADTHAYRIELASGARKVSALDPSNVMIEYRDGRSVSVLPLPLAARDALQADWAELEARQLSHDPVEKEVQVQSGEIRYTAAVGEQPWRVMIHKPLDLANIDVLQMHFMVREFRMPDEVAFAHGFLSPESSMSSLLKRLRVDVGVIQNERIMYFGHDLVPLGNWNRVAASGLWVIARLPRGPYEVNEAEGLVFRYRLAGAQPGELYWLEKDMDRVLLLDADQGRDAPLLEPGKQPLAINWQGHAESVVVVGDFNEWDPTRTPMNRLGPAPDGEGSIYQATVYLEKGWYRYGILADGEPVLDSFHADTLAMAHEDSELWPLSTMNVAAVGRERWHLSPFVSIQDHSIVETSGWERQPVVLPRVEFQFDADPVIARSEMLRISLGELNWSGLTAQVSAHEPEIVSSIKSVAGLRSTWLTFETAEAFEAAALRESPRLIRAATDQSLEQPQGCDELSVPWLPRVFKDCSAPPARVVDELQVVAPWAWQIRREQVQEGLAAHAGSPRVHVSLRSEHRANRTAGHRVADALARATLLADAAAAGIGAVRFDGFLDSHWAILNFDGALRFPAFKTFEWLGQPGEGAHLDTGFDELVALETPAGEMVVINRSLDTTYSWTECPENAFMQSTFGEALDSTRWLLHESVCRADQALSFKPLSLNKIYPQ